MPEHAPMRNPGYIRSPRNFGALATKQYQPDWQITEDAFGIMTGSLSYVTIASAYTLTVPTIGSTHPFCSKVQAYKNSTSFSRNGKATVTTEYIGMKGATVSLPEWDFSANTAETSILFHPRIVEFAIKEIPKPKSNGIIKWKEWVKLKPQTNEFDSFMMTAPGGLAGVTKYLIPRGMLKYSFYCKSSTVANEFVTNLACWDISPKYGPKDVLPKTQGNWLLHSVGITPYGKMYKVNVEWMLSEHGIPWNEYIYPKYGSQSGGSGGFNNTTPKSTL